MRARIPMRLRVGAGTDTGRVRPLNEDAFMTRAAEGLFVVCDGMGGAPAGEVASQMAIDVIGEQLDGPIAGGATLHAGPGYLPHTRRLADAVWRSNELIFEQAQRDPRRAGMGSTVVGVWIREQIVSVAHVGDSRAYLWHGNQLEPLTRDHSLVEAHRAAGLEEEAKQLPAAQHNVLVRVLGRERDVDVDVCEVPVQRGDYVLLCSDGLTRMVSDEDLRDAIERVQEPQKICDHLIAVANRNGGADNITVVVVKVTGSWWERLLDRWKRTARRGNHAEAYAAV